MDNNIDISLMYNGFRLDDLINDRKAYAIVGPNNYKEIEISGFVSTLIHNKGKFEVYIQKARVDKLFKSEYFNDCDCNYGEVIIKRLVKTENKAKELVKFREVKLTNKEWFNAIGDRNILDSIEECELQSCCAVISNIRDILIKCKEKNGLIVYEIEELKQNIDEHEEIEGKVLEEIFKQLGID